MNFKIDDVVGLAEEAGAKILEYYNDDIEVMEKGDSSPLTKADLAAHHVIVDGLKKLTPEIPIISEESGIPEYSQRKVWEQFWLVDPLDGTKEFIKRNGEFTVNIALVKGERPVFGVVNVPATKTTYYGSPESGSFKKESSGNITRLNVPAFSGKQARIVVSRSHGDNSTIEKLNSLGIEVTEEVPSGSSLKFCLLAEGKADLYPRFGPTMEWDTAAADAVYRYSVSGGEKFSPLSYNKESFRNPYFILGPEQLIDAESL